MVKDAASGSAVGVMQPVGISGSDDHKTQIRIIRKTAFIRLADHRKSPLKTPEQIVEGKP